MKAKATIKTPKDFLESLKEPRKTEITQLHKLIRKLAPSLKPFIQYGMLGYGPYHYKYESGREGDWFGIGLASQKNYISLYICSLMDGKYIPEMYKKELPQANVGKSCIRIKNAEDLPVGVLKKMIRDTLKAAKSSD